MKHSLFLVLVTALISGCGGGSWRTERADIFDPKTIAVDLVANQIIEVGVEAFSNRKQKPNTQKKHTPLIECSLASVKTLLMFESSCNKVDGEVNWDFMAICETWKGDSVMKSTECHKKEYRIVGRPKPSELEG